MSFKSTATEIEPARAVDGRPSPPQRKKLAHFSAAFIACSGFIATAFAVFAPSNVWLSATQLLVTSDTKSPEFSGPQSSGSIQIIPRAAAAGSSFGNFRDAELSSGDRQPLPAERSPQGSVSRQRGILHLPVFSGSPGNSSPDTTQPSLPQSGRAESSIVLSGHSGILPLREPQRGSDGYNYVHASGVADLPYAGRQPAVSADREQVVASQNRVARPTTWQASGVSPFNHQFSGPGSPVPEVPNLPDSPPGIQIPGDSPIQNHSIESAPGFEPEPTPFDPSFAPQPPRPLIPGSSGAAPVGGGGSYDQQLPQNSGVPYPAAQSPEIQAGPYSGQPQSIPQPPSLSQAGPRHQPQPPTPSHNSHIPPQGNFGAAPGTSGFRATVESDAPGWINPYMGRAATMPAGTEQSPTPVPAITMPANFAAWWDVMVQQSAGIAPRSMPVDVTTLVEQALVYSPQVQVLQAEPEVQQRIVRQEEAAFDWRAFLDSQYNDLSDPIGNTLTTGNNASRFVDQNTYSAGGIKRRTTTGGEVTAGQRFGYQANNSRFLLPNPQSTSRLELSFRQPLLSRAGTVYSQNQIVLARINANSSSDETLEELQLHLYGVAETYWKLYRARAEFFQRQKLLTSARTVLNTLEARNQVDTIPRQILRARAAVARAESRMQRAVTDIRNAESQLRLMVNNPDMLNGGQVEFTPTETPSMFATPVGLRESLQTALVNRPDISHAIRQMRASGVRMGVSKSEMLPKLDFIVSSYVAGLQNSGQFADSFNDQFNQGRPGYTVGMEFEFPLGNRAAKARMEQRQWELKRAISGFRATVETSLTEVEISSREVETAWRELLGKYQAMMAAENEVRYLDDRFKVLPMVEESSMLLLEDLLDGYERLADEEAAFAAAQTSYALSLIQLRRATGTLMRSRYDSPDLNNDESEWMASRADQAAAEVESQNSRNVSLTRERRPESSVVVGHSAQLAGSNTLNVTEKAATVAPQPKPRKVDGQVGGHSFGTKF